jgi:hypothetical protein
MQLGSSLIGVCKIENIMIVVNAIYEFISWPSKIKVRKVDDKMIGQASQ